MRLILRLLNLIRELAARLLSLWLLATLRACLRTSTDYPSQGLREWGVLLVGPRFLFGKGIDLRECWEIIRRENVIYVPYRPSHLNGLELAVNLLMPKSREYLRNKPYCLVMYVALLLNDESGDSGNHKIGCHLAKYKLLSTLGFEAAGRRQLREAYEEYRRNCVGCFYDEGSTHYHVFTTALFAMALRPSKVRRLFGRQIYLAQVLQLEVHLCFGDTDPFDVTADSYGVLPAFNECKELYAEIASCRIIESFTTKFFNSFKIDEVEVYVKKENFGVWGHEKEQCGDVRVLYNGRAIIYPENKTGYTISLEDRISSKYHCKNGIFSTQLRPSRYFAPIPRQRSVVSLFGGKVHVKNDFGRLEVEVLENGRIAISADFDDALASCEIRCRNDVYSRWMAVLPGRPVTIDFRTSRERT